MFGLDPIGQVSEAVAQAAAVDRSAWSAPARSDAVLELMAARERLDALILSVVGEWDRDQGWALDGAISPVAWLAHRLPITRQDASVLVRSARHVAQHEKTAKALDAGDITAAHVTLIARAVRHREVLYPEHEDVILDAARSLSPAGFRKAMEHWRNCADAVLDQKDTSATPDRCYLDIADTFGGSAHLDGWLDSVSAATLKKVLDTMEPPDPVGGPEAPRTIGQRRAAALIRLANGEKPPVINLDVMLDLDTLAGRPSFDLTTGCCEISGHGAISPALAQMLACDAAIGRVLMRGKSEVLDVGRRTRLVTPTQRRALQIRDGNCVEEGCTIPGDWCDAHHIVHWIRHGPTDLANLELRCRGHHLKQHQRDLEAALRKSG